MARSDAELVAAVLGGDPHAFEEIVARHQRLVFNIIYRYFGRRDEIEDLAQEVFLKMFASLRSFDNNRPLVPWISRITANCCLDEVRKIRRRKLTLFSDLSEGEEARIEYLFGQFNQGALSQEQAEESFQLMQKVMRKLSKKEKMAFVLRELQGLSYSEVAEVLGTTELGARIRVSRSRKKLHQEFAKILFEKGGN